MKSLQTGTYSVFIGPLAQSLGSLLEQAEQQTIFILVDENTRKCCLPMLIPCIPETIAYKIIDIPAGECHKNIHTCEKIWAALLEAGAERNTLLLNLGGGVIGDMGGFCAAAYKRGIAFIQIPTTLLAQVDASVGGKLGIDFGGIKNSIGLFRDPEAVCIDPDFWQTLPPREFRSGFAEVIKHALIADPAQWSDILVAGSAEAYMTGKDALYRTLEIKRRIVLEDPFEKGIRKALNFGHTIGHAVEAWSLESKNPLLHGEAVALGMMAETLLSVQMTGLEEQTANEINTFLGRIFMDLPQLPESVFGQLLKRMANDKKNTGGQVNFTLLAHAGLAKTDQYAEADAIVKALHACNNLRSAPIR
jgi:3-dehydroquinate synthase